MANKSTKTKSTDTVETAPAQDSVYTIAELADNHKIFGTFREIVVVALREAGESAYTFAEARKIIENFKNKEVK